MSLRDLLADPRLDSVNVDSVDRIVKHREILLDKRMIREVFFEIYRLLQKTEAEYFGVEPGQQIEIGSGSSLLKNIVPTVELTDLVPYEGLDRVVDAMNMPYEAGSLKTVFGIHCFHHLPDPFKFLSEVSRVCRPGGGAILVEPYFGPVASVVFKHLFSNEHFDKAGPAILPHAGPMTGANQALSYIVFKRDRDKLSKMFPELEIVSMEPIGNYMRYLLSGGVNFRQLMPDASIPMLKMVESALWPLRRVLALHQIIVVRKR